MAQYGKGRGPAGNRPMGEDDQEKRGLDAQIAVGVEGNLKRPTATGQPEQLKPTAQVIKEVLVEVEAGLNDESDQGEARLDQGLVSLLTLARMRKGVPRGADSVGHATNADTKLEPATDKFLEHHAALQQEAGGVVADIDPAKVKADRDRARNLRDFGQEFTQFGADCDAMRSHPERRNEAVLRNVRDRLEPLKKPLGAIYGKLGLVIDYASGDALQGAQTRVTVDKAVAAATEKTAALYEKQGQSQGGGTPAGPGTGSGATGNHPTGALPGAAGTPPGTVTPPSARPPRKPKARGPRGG